MRMAERVAIITGASRGLGRSMALHLARAGVGIIGTYRRSREEAAAVADEVRGAGVGAAMLPLEGGDVGGFDRFADAVRAALADTFDRSDFDFLVNNAGIGTAAPITEFTEAQFDELIDVQLKGPFFLTQRLLPLIADGGRILNVSSGLARFSNPGMSVYASAKGAIEVLTRYQALELGSRGIRVNVIAPGAIATDFGGGRVRDDEQANRAVAQSTALGRVGEADDIGAAVAAILSDGFAWANGTRIEVSGGQRL